MGYCTTPTETRVKRAFTRRFGASVLPLEIRFVETTNGNGHWKVTDCETGTWATYRNTGMKLVLMEEHDACA